MTLKEITNKLSSILYSPEYKGKTSSKFTLKLSYNDKASLIKELPSHGLPIPIGECDEDIPDFKLSCNYGGVLGLVEIDIIQVSYLVDGDWKLEYLII